MRIAMFSHYLPGASKGGVGYQVHRLANQLVHRGHQVTIFSPQPRPAGALYRHVFIPLPGQKKNPVAEPFLLAAVLADVDLAGFDVLHAHGDNQFMVDNQVPALRTFYGTALMEALTSPDPVQAWRQLALYPLEFLAGSLVRRSVAISEATRRYLPFVARVIPCGVELDVFFPGGQKSSHPSLLFVGTMDGRKRGEWLRELFVREIRPVLPTAELWMVGGKQLCQPGVVGYPAISTGELVELYRRAWAFCLPSTYEGFGVPYIEAMACGTPVVATPNAGAREVLGDGSYGLLSSDAELAADILRLLQDAGLREHYREAGLCRARSFDMELIAAQYEEEYGLVQEGPS